MVSVGSLREAEFTAVALVADKDTVLLFQAGT